ncbi:hypothetical protein [Psychroflexus sediminis]|uniref:Lipoprotein n=1 Tax=Psychroflexus sediminis TaxID=470826 RepID=A0A1G7XSL4_9FLAO|nr:hypothetical protein [Psychroflexus sediminis]SDG87212.1 hypothetical protein SAMN04488027_109107 [Psychroflexus sediminis]
MKKFKLLFALIILFFSFSFVACTNDENNLNNGDNQNELLESTKIPYDMGGIKFGSIVLPRGTKSRISDNGSRLDFKLPENYIYIATDANGKAFIANRGSYTCESTCSGGCDVVKLGKVVGCSACPEGSTESCTGSRGKETIEENKSSFTHQIGDGQRGGLINLESGINFMTDSSKRENSNKNVPSFDVLMKLPKFESEFKRFYDKLWDGNSPNNKNSKAVLVDFYGQTISLLIPLENYKKIN